MTDYVPVACSFHDQLEHLAMRRTRCRFHYRSGDGQASVEGKVADIVTADGAEYLVLADGGARIRLDAINRIEELSAQEPAR